MNFLYPGFLIALLTVAIPIIIHLFNFRKFKKVYFSNVAFLKEIKEQNSSREKIKNLLILLSRILAIVCLVLAFARPYRQSASKLDASKGNIVSIYIDNSYSMEAINKEGSLLDEAKREAKEIVKSFDLNDRFQLLTNDFEGKHQRLLNPDEFLQALEEVKISSASRVLQQILTRQQSIFTVNSNCFIYIISDFQKGFVTNNIIPEDNSINISLVKLNANELPNIAVDSVWLVSPVHQVNTTEKLIVKLRNYGNEDAKNIPLKLMLNKQQKGISSLNILAGKTRLDTISFSGLSSGWQKGIISIKDFPLTFDDELNFSFKVIAEQNILSINGLKAGRYISALYSADSYFKLKEMPETNINYSSLSNYSLIVLNQLANPSTGLAQELKIYITNGGSVVVFPDLDADKELYSKFLNAINLPSIEALKTESIKVSSIDLRNPIFRGVFESLPQNLNLPEVKRHFVFKENNRTNKENLLQLPANNLFFARYTFGEGRVYLSATSLNSDDSDFSKDPIFVPLMYKIAFASGKEMPLFYTAMKDNMLTTQKVTLGANQFLKLVGNGFEVIPEVRNVSGKSLLYIADQIKGAGFYDLKKEDSTLAVFAFNENRAESDMHYYSKSEVKKLFNNAEINFLDTKSDRISSALSTKNNGIELWKLCLILALVFLAIEILLIRFYSIHKI